MALICKVRPVRLAGLLVLACVAGVWPGPVPQARGQLNLDQQELANLLGDFRSRDVAQQRVALTDCLLLQALLQQDLPISEARATYGALLTEVEAVPAARLEQRFVSCWLGGQSQAAGATYGNP